MAGAFLYLAVRDLDWLTFWDTLKTGDYKIVLLTIPIASFNYFIRAVRWSVFIRSEKKVSLPSIFWANMAGYLGNAFLPARAGELLRSAFLGQKSGLGTSFILATALAERLLDVIALVLIGSIALLGLGSISPLLANAVLIMAIASVTGLAIIFGASFRQEQILQLIKRLPLPSQIAEWVSRQTSRFLTGMRSLQSWRRITTFTLLTGVIWFLDAFNTTIGVHIIAQNLSIAQALILLSALGLSSAIPSTPGNLGVYQFVAVAVLMPFGFSRSDALAYILIGQILNYILVSFWGLLGLWQINRSGKKAVRTAGNLSASASKEN